MNPWSSCSSSWSSRGDRPRRVQPDAEEEEDAAIGRSCASASAPTSASWSRPGPPPWAPSPRRPAGVRGMSVLAVNTDRAHGRHVGRPERVRRRPRRRSPRSSRRPTTPRPCRRRPSSSTTPAPRAPATASFRLKDPVPWLTELGYDWGPEGPPAPDADDRRRSVARPAGQLVDGRAGHARSAPRRSCRGCTRPARRGRGSATGSVLMPMLRSSR